MSRPEHLLILRHGQTDHNLEGRIQGQLQIPLNDHGRSQAQELANVLGESLRPPQVLIASDLIRASETAAILAQSLGLPEPRLTPLWRARFLAEYQGQTRPDLESSQAPGFPSWQEDPLRNAPPGGERGLDQRERVRQGLEQAKELFTGGVEVAGIVTHVGCLQAALHLVGGAPQSCPQVELGNGAILELKRQGKNWTFSHLYPCLNALG